MVAQNTKAHMRSIAGYCRVIFQTEMSWSLGKYLAYSLAHLSSVSCVLVDSNYIANQTHLG